MKHLSTLLETVIHLVGDPESPITFTEADERGVRPVANACRKPAGALYKPRVPLNRNAFLCGCLDATDRDDAEHLLVGFGYRHGSTTKIASIAHNGGSPDAVDIPSHVRSAMLEHVRAGFANEVILFHNHPPNWLNAVADNLPLPSLTDRATLTELNRDPTILVKALWGGGRLRFFLGENGFVREFRTPHARMALQYVQQLGSRTVSQRTEPKS